MYRLIVALTGVAAAAIVAGALAQGRQPRSRSRSRRRRSRSRSPPDRVLVRGRGRPGREPAVGAHLLERQGPLHRLLLRQLTNASNGNSITLNASGPVGLTPEGDNLRLVSGGSLIFFFFPGDAGPGDVSTGRTYLVRGRASVLVDPVTLAFLSFESNGNVTDLCAELA